MRATRELGNCPFCLSPVGADEDKVRCPKCGVTHHADCWQANGRCSVYGCDGWAVWSEKIADRVAPATEDAVIVTESQLPKRQQVYTCISCGREVRRGQMTCFSCLLRSQRYRFENCSGPSLIVLGGLVGSIVWIVRAIVS